MKKLIVVLFAFIFSVSISAQSPISKGSFTVGGSISYSSETFEKQDTDYSIFRFNPQFGYFFVDNFYTAISITYNNYSWGKYSTDQVGLGPAIRYYFDAEKLKPFIGVAYGYLKQTDEGDDDDDKITSSEWRLTAGADYFITESFALEASLNYSFINYDYPDVYYNNDRKSKMFQVGVGVNYFIY